MYVCFWGGGVSRCYMACSLMTLLSISCLTCVSAKYIHIYTNTSILFNTKLSLPIALAAKLSYDLSAENPKYPARERERETLHD